MLLMAFIAALKDSAMPTCKVRLYEHGNNIGQTALVTNVVDAIPNTQANSCRKDDMETQ